MPEDRPGVPAGGRRELPERWSGAKHRPRRDLAVALGVSPARNPCDDRLAG